MLQAVLLLSVQLLLVVLLVVAPAGAAAAGSRLAPGASGQRALQQQQAVSAAADNQELPRLNIGKVTATQVNSYAWTISRQSSASGIAVTADGYSRKQLGYSLTYTRTLQKQQFRLEGVAAITNPSGQGSAALQSLTLLVGGREVQPTCQGMPAASYTLQPAAVVECAFTVTWEGTAPAADTVSGYVQTSFGRAAATSAPIAFSFVDCGSSSSSTSSSSDAPAAAACSVQEVGACVSVTDGSYIINKYRDRLGQAAAGTVTRSRLFDTSAIQDSTLGPPRTEPTTPQPPAAAAAAVAAVPDTPPEWTPRQPDASWWNRRLQLATQAVSGAATTTSSRRRSLRRRQLLQQQQQQSKADLVASLDANFQWPYPTITGDRPPVGINGRPSRGQPSQICSTRTFQYGLVFGPLLPSACGTFEVQNMAAALPSDSAAAVTSSTYTYLQVLCPTAAAAQERASNTDAVAAAAAAAAGRGGS